MNDITVQELKQRLDAGENIRMIDVREAGERAEFNIGGEFIPLGFLIQNFFIYIFGIYIDSTSFVYSS